MPAPDWKDAARPIVVGLTLALIASVPVTTWVGVHTEREVADARLALEAKRDTARIQRERDLVYLQQALASDPTLAGRTRVLEQLTEAQDPMVSGWAREELNRSNGETNARERVCKERAGQCGDACASTGGAVGTCVRGCLERAWDECARQSIAQRQASVAAPAALAAPAAPAPPAPAPTAEQVVASREPPRQAPIPVGEAAPRVAPRSPAVAPAPASTLRSGPGSVDFGL